MNDQLLHKFHIPVMGLAYTIDSPVKVACYGINSVISIIEDKLIEMMRSYYYPQIDEPYQPITPDEKDYRAKRITDYLNLVNKIVQMHFERLKQSVFEAGSEIVKYFEMLPNDSKLRQLYIRMTQSTDNAERKKLENFLRTQIKAGSIDVNIMTKVDKNNYDKQGVMLEDGSDAVSALRGYAKSNLTNSSIIFSAGMNPRLFNYLGKCEEFEAIGWGVFDKKVIIKVSDYRSALIQGKYLAKKGVWVSEFRIESGLNCGGHAFATDGYLMGPILEEFKRKKNELVTTLFDIYRQALTEKGGRIFNQPHPVVLSVQGGIGTYEEDDFLHQHYGISSTGWGTPFLLVPEATTVDKDTLELLRHATKKDVVLSKNSPLGVRFYYLKGTSSEKEKINRIENGKPGSPCTEKYLVSNTEFTKEPICTASRRYQRLKIVQLKSMDLPEDEYQRRSTEVLDKECLCIGLSNAAAKEHELSLVKKLEAVTICPGPNVSYFSKVVSLKEMTDHIYGRSNIIQDQSRPHLFINELFLYISYFKEQLLDASSTSADGKQKRFFLEFYKNLMDGIAYYRNLMDDDTLGHLALPEESMKQDLDEAEKQLCILSGQYLIESLPAK